MKIRKAYKFRLKPNGEQIAQLENYVGACRFLWNKALGINLDRLSSGHALLWYQELDYWSKVWKSSEDFGFLKEVPAHCLQQKLKDLSKAFQDGFDKTQPLKRLPRFKKRGLGDSIRFPEPKQFDIKNRRIKFPKLGWIGFHKSQEIEGDLKNMTITRAADHWFVSIQVEVGLEAGPHASSSCLGIDVGVNQFVSTSEGSSYPSPNAFKQWADRLRKAQRQLSKKQKFSKNWKKLTLGIQKIHKKIANIRNDFLHKLSTQLSKSHAMIVIEDLKIVNMSKSAKGTLEAPGKKVRAKSSLNQSILDQGWGEFKRQLGISLIGWEACWLR